MSKSKIISMDEVKKHNNKKSLWMVIHNSIYDVTAFLKEHPGGEDALLHYAGIDGTTAFEDVGHSSDARELLKKFKIGELPETECTSEGPNLVQYIPHVIFVLAVGLTLGLFIKRQFC